MRCGHFVTVQEGSTKQHRDEIYCSQLRTGVRLPCGHVPKDGVRCFEASGPALEHVLCHEADTLVMPLCGHAIQVRRVGISVAVLAEIPDLFTPENIYVY